MPSNRELAADIHAIARELGRDDVSTEGLKNVDLAELLSQLRAERPDPSSAEPVVEKPVDEAPAVEPVVNGAPDFKGGHPGPVTNPPAPKFALSVAPGRAVQSRRGMLREHSEVTDSDFDVATLARLIEIGCVIRK